MLHRGSLKSCVAAAAGLLGSHAYAMLCIIHSPGHKDYAVASPTELENRDPDSEGRGSRLLFYGTLGEIKQFLNTPQPDLFKEPQNGADTQALAAGQLDRDIPPDRIPEGGGSQHRRLPHRPAPPARDNGPDAPLSPGPPTPDDDRP